MKRVLVPSDPVAKSARTPAPDAAAGRLPFEILESRLSPRPLRAGTVERPRLIDELRGSTAPVVAVTAPAGYGKTTMLSQWVGADDRALVWLSLDEHDNDPAVLLGYLAVAFERVVPVDGRVFEALGGAEPAIRSVVVPALGAAMFAGPPLALVLDDVHRLHEEVCVDAIMALVEHLPPQGIVILAGRSVMGVPVARLRAQGRLLEIGPDALALDVAETGAVLADAGVRVSEAELAALADATEGWAAAVFLSAISAKQRQDRGATSLSVSAGDRLVHDYLSLELLADRDEPQTRFLLRTAALDRMCGPLCDDVLGETGSAAMLESLERSGQFVQSLGCDWQWYRYHPLVGQMLRAELERHEPGATRAVHRAAAAWCERNGLAEEAVRYADAAEDLDHVAVLVADLAMPVYDGGGVATVEGWMERLDGDVLHDHPAVSVFGAWIHALRGRPLEAARWADMAGRGVVGRPLPDGGTSIEPWLALFRGAACADGVTRMRDDAELALGALEPRSPWRAMALLVLGVAHMLAGDDEAAEIAFADASEVALNSGTACTASLVLAERSLLALRQGDPETAESLVRAAQGVVRDAGMAGYVTTSLVHAAAARCALRRGDPAAAGEELSHAAGLRPLLTYALPWLSVQAGIQLAHAHIGVADPAGARAIMAGVDAIRRRRPHLGTLDSEADQLSAQVAALRGSSVEWASTLTPAELRLLPLLSTHLSFREIGERLFVSRNTVKTEAISVYRKLGVTSRSEAIERASELGLVAESALARPPVRA